MVPAHIPASTIDCPQGCVLPVPPYRCVLSHPIDIRWEIFCINTLCYSLSHTTLMHTHTQTLHDLNDKQREAVTTTDGALLILAGAGSGKTRVITHRILHLIEQGVAPEQILAVTFTNKAAKEMRERVLTLLGHHGPATYATQETLPLLTTFHALGVRILRTHHERIGLRKQFTIYDRSDSQRAIKRALEEAGFGNKQFEPRRVLSLISHAKGAAHTRATFSEQTGSYPEEVAATVWQRYEQILKDEQALDFDDLLLKTLTLLREHADIRESYHARFQYLHIDEYQDTNKVQYEIARAIVGERANICAVGDIDQNIYSWRGADMNNIMQFERHFPGAKIILLEENYRSTQTIVSASNTIIEKNKNRVPKVVFTTNPSGEPLSLYIAYNETDEAQFVAQTAATLIADGVSPADIAVLFRTNFQSRVLEEAFLTADIPYQMLGVRFFERREVKDVLSFLRLALNPESTSDLARIINVPPRGIGKVTLIKLLEKRRDSLTGATAQKVAQFYTLMDDIAEHARTTSASETLRYIITHTGIEASLKDGGEEEQERLENLRELVSLATHYDSHDGTLTPEDALTQLLESAALQSDQDELATTGESAVETVKLMTVHAAKGLEFPYVCITGLEEGLFPHELPENEGRGGVGRDAEEERRLFYVALTRAEKKVFLSYAMMRTIFGSQHVNAPSTFLLDLKEEHLDQSNPVAQSGFERTVYLE